MTNDKRGDEPDEGHIPEFPEGRDFDVDVEIDIDDEYYDDDYDDGD